MAAKNRKRCQANTFRTYYMIMNNHVIPYFRKKGIKLQKLCPVIVKEFRLVFLIKGMAQDAVRRIVKGTGLVVQPCVHASEIRQPALRGDAGPAEKHRIGRLVQPLPQQPDLLLHVSPSRSAARPETIRDPPRGAGRAPPRTSSHSPR